MVIFRLPGSEPRTCTTPPARSTSQASSVACASSASEHASARSSAARRKTCGVCTAHSRVRGSVPHDGASVVTDLLDRVGHRRGGDHRVGFGRALELGQRLLVQLRRGQRTRGVVDDHRVALAAGGKRRPHRVRAMHPAGNGDRSLRGGVELVGGERDHDRPHRRHGPQRDDAPLQHRPATKRDERLGPARPKALASPCGHDQRDRHSVNVTPTWRRPPPCRSRCRCRYPARSAACTGAPPPAPRSSPARTSARRRGSSWRA